MAGARSLCRRRAVWPPRRRARDLAWHPRRIATTHSPTLLAHVSTATLADVLAFGRSPDDATTIAKRVGDLPHFATLRDSHRLDQLVSTGWLERAI